MMNTTVRARVSQESKVAAMANAKILGLDLSTVIRMVVNQLAVKAELPEGLMKPNNETLQAIENLEKGIGVHEVNTVDELKRDLGW